MFRRLKLCLRVPKYQVRRFLLVIEIFNEIINLKEINLVDNTFVREVDFKKNYCFRYLDTVLPNIKYC